MAYTKGKPASNAIPVTKERLIEKFYASVDTKDPEKCWNWTGPKQLSYGLLQVGKRKGPNHFYERAHRFAIREIGGQDLSKDDLVCHQCDNPSCVNPAHLFIGTHLDNMRDKRIKNRHARGEKSKRGHLTASDIKEIIRLRTLGRTYKDIAEIFSVHPATPYKICHGKSWKHIEREV
jgi:hypothetical protein